MGITRYSGLALGLAVGFLIAGAAFGVSQLFKKDGALLRTQALPSISPIANRLPESSPGPEPAAGTAGAPSPQGPAADDTLPSRLLPGVDLQNLSDTIAEGVLDTPAKPTAAPPGTR
jgi:hypothetical protein